MSNKGLPNMTVTYITYTDEQLKAAYTADMLVVEAAYKSDLANLERPGAADEWKAKSILEVAKSYSCRLGGSKPGYCQGIERPLHTLPSLG